jgi:hypothetical protein
MDSNIFRKEILGIPVKVLKSGQPCDHPGCIAHSTHPCEVCGRINAKGDVTVDVFEYEIKLKH